MVHHARTHRTTPTRPRSHSDGQTKAPRSVDFRYSMTDTWDTIADWYADNVVRGSAIHQFARDVLLDALPADMSGQRALDLGCGEGLISRATAGRGAQVVGVDPTVRLIERARAIEATAATGATYHVDDGCTLATVADDRADWVTAGLSLNNVPDLGAALASIGRALVSGGQLVFTVPHPCFEAPHARWIGGERVVGTYSTEGFWRSANHLSCSSEPAGRRAEIAIDRGAHQREPAQEVCTTVTRPAAAPTFALIAPDDEESRGRTAGRPFGQYRSSRVTR
jgi:SAM-dependent methyltransferase